MCIHFQKQKQNLRRESDSEVVSFRDLVTGHSDTGAGRTIFVPFLTRTAMRRSLWSRGGPFWGQNPPPACSLEKTFPASETADTDDDEEAKEEEDSTAETDDEEGEEGDDEGDEEEEGEESDGDEDEEGEDDEHEEESEAEETQVAPVPAAATPAPAKQPPLPAKRKTEDKEPADKKLRFEPKGKK